MTVEISTHLPIGKDRETPTGLETFPYSGIEECKEISSGVVRSAVDLFEQYFDPNTHALYSWGSVARREMGPYSDLDFIIVSENPDFERIQQYQAALSNSLPNHYLDILGKSTPQELKHIAKIDGTDRQAILFLREEKCNDHDMMRETVAEIQNDKSNNLREIFHILANLEFVYPNLFGPANLKFGPGRLKDFHFAFLVAKFLDDEKKVSDIPSALSYLHEKGYLTYETVSSNLRSFDTLIFLRNRTQEINGTYHSVLDEQSTHALGESLNVTEDTIQKFLESRQRSVRDLYSSLKSISIGLAAQVMDKNASDLLRFMVLNPQLVDETIVNEIMRNQNEILMMLLTYITDQPEILEILREANPTRWYVLYGIANNRHADENTLLRMMSPPEGEQTLKDLYEDFAWRNIYLYIAKNPSATDKIRQYILDYPHARQMDIAAAQKKG